MLIRYLVPHNASKELCNAMLLIVFHYSQSTLSFSLSQKKVYIYALALDVAKSHVISIFVI